MANRIEIIGNDQLYAFWAGDGLKDLGHRGVFSIDNNNNAFFSGSLNSALEQSSLSDPSFSTTNTVTTAAMPGHSHGKLIIFSLFYYNVGTSPTDVTSVGPPNAVIKLSKSINGASFVELTRMNIEGTLRSVYNGTNYDVVSNINNSITFTDPTTPSGSTFTYQLSYVTNSGAMPILLNGLYGTQRLSISATEVK